MLLSHFNPAYLSPSPCLEGISLKRFDSDFSWKTEAIHDKNKFILILFFPILESNFHHTLQF